MTCPLTDFEKVNRLTFDIFPHAAIRKRPKGVTRTSIVSEIILKIHAILFHDKEIESDVLYIAGSFVHRPEA